MAETILITGGAGFIGSHLSKRLVAEGYRVVVVDSLSSYYSPARKRANLKGLLKSKNFSFYKVDIRNKQKLTQVLNREKPDKIVHLASEVGVRPSFERAGDYLSTNVGGTYQLLELAKRRQIKQLIFGSSSSVYGKRSGKRGFFETDKLKPISPYAATKQAAETLCHSFASEGLKTTILRLFTVYGPRNRPDMAAYRFVDRIASGKVIELFGTGTKRDFTYVTDIVDGMVRALKTPFDYQVINLGNSSPVAVLKLIKLIEKTLGKKAKIKRVKLPPGDVPATFANVSKAKKLLGWKPKTSLDEGVGRLVDWYTQR